MNKLGMDLSGRFGVTASEPADPAFISSDKAV